MTAPGDTRAPHGSNRRGAGQNSHSSCSTASLGQPDPLSAALAVVLKPIIVDAINEALEQHREGDPAHAGPMTTQECCVWLRCSRSQLHRMVARGMPRSALLPSQVFSGRRRSVDALGATPMTLRLLRALRDALGSLAMRVAWRVERIERERGQRG